MYVGGHIWCTPFITLLSFFGREISFYTIPITSNCFLNKKDFNLCDLYTSIK